MKAWNDSQTNNLLCGSSKNLNLSALDSSLFYFFFLSLNWLDDKFFKIFLQQENFWLFVLICFKWCHSLQLFCIWAQKFLITVQKFCIGFVIFCQETPNFWKGLQIFCNDSVLSCKNIKRFWKCLQNSCTGFVSNLYGKIFKKSCIIFVQVLQ